MFKNNHTKRKKPPNILKLSLIGGVSLKFFDGGDFCLYWWHPLVLKDTPPPNSYVLTKKNSYVLTKKTPKDLIGNL